MAANTITGQQALFKVAQDAGETWNEFIASVTSQTVLIVRGIERDPHVTLKYALARLISSASSGIRQITAWNPSTQTVTLASGFDVTAAAGNVLTVMGADGKKRGEMFDAINEAIRAAYPFWYQETIVNASSSTITLATGTHSYSLPTDMTALIAIGIQDSSTDAIDWVKVGDEAADFFAVEGQEGAFTIRFHPRFTRNGSFADEYNGEKLCTWYAVREPEIASEAGTTQLPLQYFAVASEIYKRRGLQTASPDKLQVDALTAQSLGQLAQNELAKLGIGKAPPNPLVAKAYASAQPQAKPQKRKEEPA